MRKKENNGKNIKQNQKQQEIPADNTGNYHCFSFIDILVYTYKSGLTPDDYILFE